MVSIHLILRILITNVNHLTLVVSCVDIRSKDLIRLDRLPLHERPGIGLSRLPAVQCMHDPGFRFNFKKVVSSRKSQVNEVQGNIHIKKLKA